MANELIQTAVAAGTAKPRDDSPLHSCPIDEQRQWQLIDLCFAFAMDEATALRHRIPLKDAEWTWVPQATRRVLPELAKEAGYKIPHSFHLVETDQDAKARAMRDLMPLARQIVPLHGQATAVLRWFQVLTRLEARGRLRLAAFPQEVTKTLRASPYAYQSVDKEITDHREAYFDRHGDRGGWAQLSLIIEWTLFLHLWQSLEQHAVDQSAITREVAALEPGTSLLTFDQIRSLDVHNQR